MMSDNAQNHTPEQLAEMERYSINYDGEEYEVNQRRYNKLKNAIIHAKTQEEKRKEESLASQMRNKEKSEGIADEYPLAFPSHQEEHEEAIRSSTVIVQPPSPSISGSLEGTRSRVTKNQQVTETQHHNVTELPHPAQGRAERLSSTASTYRSEYETARNISVFISFLGWVVFCAGIISIFFNTPTNGISTILPSIGIAISGLFLVAAGQVMRATVDNADHTREILNFLKGARTTKLK